ncbi:imidazoleglycerol-phosphate dehydratase [Desulfuribacillus stibiiarsenatis]|uniref:Imidazoleglycerol-phosphate dehydratase n=1 Tax=Desulfuribacillus stibiiarsenatis TaxID=1390249 RepID=A0A1E5L9L6_9FIRM|nr:imidazoleglycerol-phosphate dehydratase HisB [Desulfuribacillus stibiiarsenatis]OEH86811.1 imidazoleglycerol-phosphate dehydratase [Desulfuribacillus stibiiarsenatis]
MAEKATLRQAEIQRTTQETSIYVNLNIDGTGKREIDTDVPFMSHMLDLWAKHGLFDLQVKGHGDVEIDDHHTTEDMGITLGQAFAKAIGDKAGIKRYGQGLVPMDESLAEVIVDLSNRPHLEYHAQYPTDTVGTFPVELVEEFLWKFALEARITLHVRVQYGKNTHHMIEAIFKALGRALDDATQYDPRIQGVLSTKGAL